MPTYTTRPEWNSTNPAYEDIPYISKVKIPGSNNPVFIKDAAARREIEKLINDNVGAMKFQGIVHASDVASVPASALTDGSTSATISIGGTSKTFAAADAGAVVIVNKDAYSPAKDQDQEFVWNGTSWDKFGDIDYPASLGDFAFVDTGTVSVSGSPTLTASAGITYTSTNATLDGTKLSGSLTNTSISATVSGTITPTASAGFAKYDKTTGISAAAPDSGETANYTPAGNLTNSSGTTLTNIVTGVTITNNGATKISSVNSTTATFNTVITGAAMDSTDTEMLVLSTGAAGSIGSSASGTVVTGITKSDVNVATGKTDTANPKFVGTGVLIKPTNTSTNATLDNSKLSATLTNTSVTGTVSGTVGVTASAGFVKYDKANSSASVTFTGLANVAKAGTYTVNPTTT